MRETVTYVTQSRYFSPAFNAAIFDGPIRIYFAQYQESQALKLYFNLQERFGEIRKQARGIFRDRHRNIFVMLYPTKETFALSFEFDQMEAETQSLCGLIIKEKLGDDFVVGVRGPFEDDTFEDICVVIDEIVRASESVSSPMIEASPN